MPKGTWQDGAITYGDLEKDYLNKESRLWQAETQELWLYDSSSGVMITCEDRQSLAAKAGYIVAHQLGGIMIWHLSDDDSAHTLVHVLYSHLQPLQN